MSISLISHAHVYNSGSGAVTTPAIDTTGAKALVAFLTYYPAAGSGAISDSKGNTWTAVGDEQPGLGMKAWYCAAPTVGSGHTFTSSNGSNYPNLIVLALGGVAAATPFDAWTGATGSTSATSIQAGSLTPALDNEVVVSGVAYAANTPDATIDSGFTVPDVGSGTTFAVGAAYLVQTAKTAVNPTWTIPASGYGCAAINFALKWDGVVSGGGGMLRRTGMDGGMSRLNGGMD